MNNKDKKILIYGGTGHYGCEVVEKLIRKGKTVKDVSRNKIKVQKHVFCFPEFCIDF